MAVQDVVQTTGLGQWSIQLVEDAPPGLIASLPMLGRVAIVPGRMNPVEYGDDLLAMARYVGVLRTVETAGQITLSGSGMGYWLGDQNGLGDVFESPGVTLTSATFPEAIRALLPPHGGITEGTLHTGVPGTISSTFAYQTPRAAMSYVAGTMGGTWRVNGDATLDAGPESALYRTDPTCLIVRKEAAGYDVALKALAGDLSSTRDASDYTTRVVLVAAALAGGTADAGTVPYLDPQGNPVHITRIIDESDDTLIANAPARAAAALAQYNGIRRSIRLSVDEFDVAGDFSPGDTVFTYDPDAGIFDTGNEMPFRGGLVYPMAIKVLSLTWPVTEGHTVAYRSGDGEWTDLTPWIAWEASGGGEVEVADSLSNPLTSSSSIGTQVSGAGAGGGMGDTAVPDVPAFGTFTTTSYQPGDGQPRAAVNLTWSQPLNTDGSTIVDGDHYDVRYRVTGEDDWAQILVPWDQTHATVPNLPPNTGMDWQVRAVDYATPTNYGAWSATTTFTTSQDVVAPPTPAPPTVAASLIAVQVTHALGLATGGTYNLPLDMDHLEVHIGTSSGFTATSATLAGKLPATATELAGSIPVVGTFAVDRFVSAGAPAYVRVVAVDRAGNRSAASAAASATAELIDSAHITSLTASKITAGEITAAVVIGGSATFSGALSAATGTFAGSLSAATGTFAGSLSAATGTFSGSISASTITGGTVTGSTIQTGTSGQRIVLDPTGNTQIRFYGSTGDESVINAPSGSTIGINSGTAGGSTKVRVYLTPTMGELNSINASTQAQVGGRVYVTSDGTAYLGNTNSSITLSGQTSYIYSPGDSTVWSNTGKILLQANSGTISLYGAGNINLNTNVGVYINGLGGPVNLTGTSQVNLACGSSFVNVTSATVQVGSVAFQPTSLVSSSTTSSFSANVYTSSATNGQLYRVTSSRRYKEDIHPAEVPAASVLALAPVTFVDRREWVENGESPDGLHRGFGLIAEEVAELPVLGDLLVPRDEEGRPDSVSYDRLGVAILAVLREHETRIAALEAA